MFTASFVTVILKMAIPIITALISMSASKYLEKKDRIFLAFMVNILSIGGLFVFYILPQLNLLASSLNHLFNVEDLFAQPSVEIPHGDPSWVNPISEPESIPVSVDNANDIKSIVPNSDNSVYRMIPDKNGYYTKLPYQDFFQPPKPLDMTPMYKDAAKSTIELLKPTLDVIKDMPTCDLNTWGHVGQFFHGGWEVFKDIIVR
jgi:hypothetical protein